MTIIFLLFCGSLLPPSLKINNLKKPEGDHNPKSCGLFAFCKKAREIFTSNEKKNNYQYPINHIFAYLCHMTKNLHKSDLV